MADSPPESQDIAAEDAALSDSPAQDSEPTFETLATEFLSQVSQGSAPSASLGADRGVEETEIEEEPSRQVTPPPLVQHYKIGDDIYDAEFVETAVKEAERLAGLTEEAEQELAQIRQSRQNIQELEYLLKAIQGRLSDPQFYAQLQALLSGQTIVQTNTDASSEEEYDFLAGAPRQESSKQHPTQISNEDLVYSRLEQRMQQALVPLYAAQARQAMEIYFSDLEQRYGVQIPPEARAKIRDVAIDRGDFTSDHLLGVGENPLQNAFFQVLGPQLIQYKKAEKAKEEQQKAAQGLPEQSRQQTVNLQPSSSAALAREFLAALHR